MKKAMALFLSALLCVSLLAACTDKQDPAQSDPNDNGQASADDPESEKRTNLRSAMLTAMTTIDPLYTNMSSDSTVVGLIYESFYYRDARGEMYPRLATDYEVSEDGLVYTYHLKEGVQWQTGGEFKASDVVFSINRAKESPYMVRSTQLIDTVEAIDDYTVEITLTQLSPTFYMDVNGIAMLSEQAMQGKDSGFTSDMPGGTGPYTLVEWSGDEKAVFKVNENYHGDLPQITEIEYIVFGDEASALLAFEAGELDYVSVPSTDWERISASDEYGTMLVDNNMTIYLCFNCQREPFNDVRVRQAFSYAINKEDVLYAAADDLGVLTNTIGTPTYNFAMPDSSEVFGYEYNPEKARDLLAQAGYPDGLTLEEGIWTIGAAQLSVPVEVIQAQLAEVGVTAEIQMIDTAVYMDDLAQGNHQLAIMTWSSSSDTSYYASLYTSAGLGSNNLSLYQNDRVDELFALASQTLDQDLRKEYFKEAYNIAAEEAAYIPLYLPSACAAFDKDLTIDPYKSVTFWYWN